jgi:hypothetical protein
MDNPLAVLSLELGAFVLYWLVIVVIESAVLQFVRWGDLRTGLRASLLANLASAPVTLLALMFLRQAGIISLIVGLLLSILIEGLVLRRLQPRDPRPPWIAAITANLISTALLLLPINWFIQ